MEEDAVVDSYFLMSSASPTITIWFGLLLAGLRRWIDIRPTSQGGSGRAARRGVPTGQVHLVRFNRSVELEWDCRCKGKHLPRNTR